MFDLWFVSMCCYGLVRVRVCVRVIVYLVAWSLYGSGLVNAIVSVGYVSRYCSGMSVVMVYLWLWYISD